MRHRGSTPPFRTPTGETLPGSNAEVGYQLLGGLDQWVMIRGESLANPPLILLHGGPGFSEMRFFRHFNAPLEKSFTVVYWDQRGAGKSFDRKTPRSSMTVEQFIADLDELVEAVRKRVGKNKVTIFGHSWGSALGVLYAARFPEKVAAYVGSGQIGDWSAAESSSYAFALAEAQRLNNRKALKELRAIGPPPYTASSVWTERTWLQRFEGQMGGRALWNMGRIVLGGPESSVFDLPNLARGFRFSLDTMRPEVSAMNVLKLAPVRRCPSSSFSEAAITGSLQKPVWPISTRCLRPRRDSSGSRGPHEPFMDEPARFNTAMVELVRREV
jgi:pimeloyl-ACP methyl ester carboxylesterase